MEIIRPQYKPENPLSQLEEYIRENKIEHIISISGAYREEEGKEEQATAIIDEIMQTLSGKNIAILTGGTKWNIPNIATNKAKEYSIPTIGVLPECGEPYINETQDIGIIISSKYRESEWGDESPLFAKISDGIIIIGGGPGTRVEISHAIKINYDRPNENNRKPIYIAPILGFGGYQEEFSANIETIPKTYTPEKAFQSGKEAADYLLTELKASTNSSYSS